MLIVNDFLRIPRQERQIEQKGKPVSVDEEEEGKDGVYGSFRNDVGIEPITKVDRIDVVTVHNR